MESLIAATKIFQWNYDYNLNERNLKANLLNTVWAFDIKNSTVQLLRPGLFDEIDAAPKIISYNWKDKVYHLFEEENVDLFHPEGFKKPDFIFKTGPDEVTLIELKSCWLNWAEDGVNSYCLGKGFELESSEKYLNDNHEDYDDYDIIVSNDVAALRERAKKQAISNVTFLKHSLPPKTKLNVKCAALTAAYNVNNKCIKFYWDRI